MKNSGAISRAIWAPILLALVIQWALFWPQFAQDASGIQSSGIVSQVANKASIAKKTLADTPEQLEAEEFGRTVRESRQAGGASRETLEKIVLDGKRISSAKLDALISGARDYASKVGYIDQMEILPSGCEIVALAVSLQALGYELEPEDIADNYLKMDGDDESYSGSPYEDGIGLPPSIVYAANAWLADHGKQVKGQFRAFNLTKTPFNALADLTNLGYPVLVWVTEGMLEPWGGDGESWYWPEHCVVLYGVKDGKALVSDSLVGKVERDKKEFARIYKLCGNRAVALLPAK